MKSLIYIVAVICLYLLPSTALAVDESSLIRTSFQEITTAIIRNDGEAMAQRVNDETFVFYEQARSLALDSSHFDFESVSQTLTFMVFQLRYNLSKAELEALDGRGIFLWSFDSGLLNNETLAAFDIDHLEVKEETAVASVLHNGQSVPGLSIEFSKQNNLWTFDLIAFAEGVEPVFEQMREELFKGKVGLAIFLMERSYGKKIPVEILSGPLR